MKTCFILTFLIANSSWLSAQWFCFYNPNMGPHYHNSSQGIYDAAHADFNGDQHLDVVTANSTGNNISFIPGYGDGTLGAPDTFGVGATAFAITAGDFNGDDLQDVAVSLPGNVAVLIGNGDGTFQPQVNYAAGNDGGRLYTADLNGDTIPDLVEANWPGVYVLMGQGNGVFASGVYYNSNGDVNDIAIADADEDQKLDIIAITRVSLFSSAISWLRGNGDGTFGTAISYFTSDYHVWSVRAYDFDYDTHQDLVISYNNLANPCVGIHTGNGDGTFNTPVFYPADFTSPLYLYIEDMDLDQAMDVVTIEGNGFSVYKGNNDGTFDAAENFLANSSPNNLNIGDFNEDNFPDVVTPNSGMGIVVMELNCESQTMGDKEHNEMETLLIYPNPVQEMLYIELEEASEIRIEDMQGRVVYTQRCETAKEPVAIPVNSLATGIYTVTIYAKNQMRKSKFIKN